MKTDNIIFIKIGLTEDKYKFLKKITKDINWTLDKSINYALEYLQHRLESTSNK